MFSGIHLALTTYFVFSQSRVRDFAVLDPDISYSDHLPLKVTLSDSFSANVKSDISTSKSDVSGLYLRWDKAGLASFYAYQFSVLCPTTLINEYE